MIVKNIQLTNYRNIESLNLDLNPSINLFYGANAQGKTNIIEGLSYLSLLKSFRGSENKNLVKINEEYCIIEATLQTNKKFKVVINKDKRKCFINNNPVNKLSDFIGLINIVVFSPENVNLFKDSPGERRNFLDDELSKLSPSYYVALNDYKELKKSRNEIIKESKVNVDLLEAITKQMSSLNLLIKNKRKEFVDRLNQEVSLFYQKLTGSTSKLNIVYKCDFNEEDEKEEIFNKMMRNLEDDVNRGQTIYGIHRDDLLLELDDLPIDEFGSQAQNRLAVVSLKLSTLRIVKEKTGEEPLVVLDDVLSELDPIKQERLLTELKLNNQLFITSATNVTSVNENISKFEVINGQIRRN